MTILWIFYVLTPYFTPLACVILHTYEYTSLIYTANVSVRTVRRYNLPRAFTVNATLCVVYWLKFTRICHFSKQFTTHRPTSHFQQKYSMLRVCLCSEHTQHHLSFPLEGQCCECFTSSRLSWDAVGLGLPLEMPLAVTFSSCEWIINSRMRISRKFLCVILPPHDLCIRNVFRMVMSVMWKNSFLVHFHVLRTVP